MMRFLIPALLFLSLFATISCGSSDDEDPIFAGAFANTDNIGTGTLSFKYEGKPQRYTVEYRMVAPSIQFDRTGSGTAMMVNGTSDTIRGHVMWPVDGRTEAVEFELTLRGNVLSGIFWDEPIEFVRR